MLLYRVHADDDNWRRLILKSLLEGLLNPNPSILPLAIGLGGRVILPLTPPPRRTL